MFRLMLSCVLALPMLFVAVPMASALTVCHDFTLYKVAGADGDNQGRETLITQLRARQYRAILSFSSTDADALAKGQRYLRPGDVIVMGTGNGHSGFMTAQGIEHFIQVPG